MATLNIPVMFLPYCLLLEASSVISWENVLKSIRKSISTNCETHTMVGPGVLLGSLSLKGSFQHKKVRNV